MTYDVEVVVLWRESIVTPPSITGKLFGIDIAEGSHVVSTIVEVGAGATTVRVLLPERIVEVVIRYVVTLSAHSTEIGCRPLEPAAWTTTWPWICVKVLSRAWRLGSDEVLRLLAEPVYVVVVVESVLW